MISLFSSVRWCFTLVKTQRCQRLPLRQRPHPSFQGTAGPLYNACCCERVVKSAYELSGPLGWSLSRFPWHVAARSDTSLPWMGCYSIAGLLPPPPELNWPTHFTCAKKGTMRVKCLAHTAVKRGARAQFPPKLSLNKVLNFRKFSLLSPKLRQSRKS